MTSPAPQTYLERLWDAGQQHLAAARYVAARRELEAAEGIAWRLQQAGTLARLYLPLLEARRQIRFNACDGPILIATQTQSDPDRNLMNRLLHENAAAFILGSHHAHRLAGSVQFTARRTHSCLEALVAVTQKKKIRLASAANPLFAGGLDTVWSAESGKMVEPEAGNEPIIPLPANGVHEPGTPGHALARESLLVAWEALALKWQARHPMRIQVGQGWHEIAWLRLALRIDPACEPIMMRVIAIAEGLERNTLKPA